jgi:hypothetical protein
LNERNQIGNSLIEEFKRILEYGLVVAVYKFVQILLHLQVVQEKDIKGRSSINF